MSLLPMEAAFTVTFGPETILIEVAPGPTTDKTALATRHFTLKSGETRPIDILDDDDDVITKWRGGEGILDFVECREEGFGFRLVASEADKRGVAYQYVIFARYPEVGGGVLS
jgi:hypothetical protein